MSSRSVLNCLLGLIFLTHLIQAEQEVWLLAPNHEAPPINQLRASGNACGPSALLIASQMGNERWRQSYAAIPGADDRSRILALINRYGVIASSHIPTRVRYNSQKGIGIADLTDMANDMRVHRRQPALQYQLLFREQQITSQQQLQRVHASLHQSLKKGYPPVLHLQRVANRYLPRSQQRIWTPVRSHFVVLSGLPDKIPADATSFEISYVDPWGGRRLTGSIRVPDKEFMATPADNSKPGLVYQSPTLVAAFPQSRVGLDALQPNEFSVLTLASALGQF